MLLYFCNSAYSNIYFISLYTSIVSTIPLPLLYCLNGVKKLQVPLIKWSTIATFSQPVKYQLKKKQCRWDSIKITQERKMFLGGNAQLSNSREQFWVSNGNLLKSIEHREVTVILQYREYSIIKTLHMKGINHQRLQASTWRCKGCCRLGKPSALCSPWWYHGWRNAWNGRKRHQASRSSLLAGHRMCGLDCYWREKPSVHPSNNASGTGSLWSPARDL